MSACRMTVSTSRLVLPIFCVLLFCSGVLGSRPANRSRVLAAKSPTPSAPPAPAALDGPANVADLADTAAASATSTRTTRSAAQRLIQYLTGYEDDDNDSFPRNSLGWNWWDRRDRRRRGGVRLPVLVLPVAELLLHVSGLNIKKIRYADDSEESESGEENPWDEEERYTPSSHKRPVYEYDEYLETRPSYRPGRPGRRPAYKPESRPERKRRPVSWYAPEPEEPYETEVYEPENEPEYESVYRPVLKPKISRKKVQKIPSRRPAQPSVIYRRPVQPPITSKPVVPIITSTGTPQELLNDFRTYKPKRMGLPPMVLSQYDLSERILLPDDAEEEDEIARLSSGNYTYSKGGSPPRPLFIVPLRIRAVLTVPRADYSEPYLAWWDPASGNSRIHFHEGSAVTFRKALPNGQVHKAEMHVDRSEGRIFHDCAEATTVPTSRDRLNPALPDMQLFTFSGFEPSADGGGALERWEQVVVVQPGEDGAVEGEALNVYHVFLLRREVDGFIRPIRYTVSVMSSVLGPDSDGYVHDYVDVRIHKRPASFFEPNLELHCDAVTKVDPTNGEALARLEPLREFTLPRRDPRYTELFQQFQLENERHYINNVERAVRKNLLMQTTRFVLSGNRLGATSRLGVNFLGDRSDRELEGLGGSEPPGSGSPSGAEPFPYTQQTLDSEVQSLPEQFSWKDMGFNTAVRHQTNCQSCWAIATTGAVEGAMFKLEGSNEPLSEQVIVDCADQFGGKGCEPSWPKSAYDYIKNKGLPRYREKPFEDKKNAQCVADGLAPVTRISSYVSVTKNSVPAIKLAIYRFGPTVVIINNHASVLRHVNGVVYDESCAIKTKTLHAVLAIGWGVDQGQEYLLLKNSWSEAWGEAGYFRLQAAGNTCGVLNQPSYPKLQKGDILK